MRMGEFAWDLGRSFGEAKTPNLTAEGGEA